MMPCWSRVGTQNPGVPARVDGFRQVVSLLDTDEALDGGQVGLIDGGFAAEIHQLAERPAGFLRPGDSLGAPRTRPAGPGRCGAVARPARRPGKPRTCG